jgi:hypothetical protein
LALKNRHRDGLRGVPCPAPAIKKWLSYEGFWGDGDYVIATSRRFIGKKANELEQVDAGLVDELEKVQTVYERAKRDELRQVLRSMSMQEGMKLTGYSRRNVCYIRSGR